MTMKRILLIEDNPEVRENTSEILSLANYEVLVAENGKIGVDLAQEADACVGEVGEAAGVLALARGRERDEHHMRRAIELEPEAAERRITLGVLLATQSKTAEANAMLTSAPLVGVNRTCT